jgi:hypothetical protein
MRDQVPQTAFEDGNYVLNLDDSTSGGTHWIGFVVNTAKKSIYYFDSYGMPCPQECLDTWWITTRWFIMKLTFRIRKVSVVVSMQSIFYWVCILVQVLNWLK